MQAPADRNEKTEPSKRVFSYVGFLVYVAVGLVYLVGGLFFVPGLWLVPLWGGWLVGLWVAYRLMLRRSYWVVVAAPVALAILWAYVTAGWAMWGWATEDLPSGVR
jgi:hypothetical protein